MRTVVAPDLETAREVLADEIAAIASVIQLPVTDVDAALPEKVTKVPHG